MSTEDPIPNAEPTAPPPPLPAADRRRQMARTLLPPLIGVTLCILTVLVIMRVAGDNISPVGQAKPSTVAVRFLQAVAEGNAGKAIALQQQTDGDSPFLTDEVLDRSRQLAPISQIRVVVDTPELVELSYLLGREEVHAWFTPVRRPDGSYQIERGTTTVQVSRPDQFGVFINGVPLTSDQVPVFPGTYELTTGIEHIEYTDPLITVSGPEAAPQLAPSPRLSARGAEAFRAATRDSLTACMQVREVNPPGCPQSLDIADGTSVDIATVQWTLEEDPFAGVAPKLSLTDETVAEMRLRVRARLQALVTTPTGPGMVNQSAVFNTVATGRVTSDPITVRFVAS